MKRHYIFVIALLVLGLCAEGNELIGQSLPQIGTSPEVVPYKPSHSKLPSIQPCPDFRANPEKDVVYGIAQGITPPKPTRLVSVGLTEQGKEAYRNNLFKDQNEVISRISVVIDSKGKPRDPCLVRAAGFDLDQQSAEVAMQYRFKPAEKDGKPLAVRSQIEVRYQTH